MAEKPIITWQTRLPEDVTYSNENNFFAGTYHPNTNMTVQFLIWNNRGGTTKVEDLKSFSITVGFESLEDTALLQFLSGELNGISVSPTINNSVATFTAPDTIVISGKKNNGLVSDSDDNYAFFSLSLSVPKVYQLKPNDLKTMTLDVIKI